MEIESQHTDPPTVLIMKNGKMVSRPFHMENAGPDEPIDAPHYRMIPELEDGEILIRPIGGQPFIIDGRKPATERPANTTTFWIDDPYLQTR